MAKRHILKGKANDHGRESPRKKNGTENFFKPNTNNCRLTFRLSPIYQLHLRKQAEIFNTIQISQQQL